MLFDPLGPLGIHPPSANKSPLPYGTSPPLRGGASPPCDRRLQVERLKLTADLLTKTTPLRL